jgi:hypothetical protein
MLPAANGTIETDARVLMPVCLAIMNTIREEMATKSPNPDELMVIVESFFHFIQTR